MNDSHKELLYGCVAGSFGQLITYPIDTLKTRIQLRNYSLSNLYKGVSSPLVSVMLEKGLLFYSYDVIRQFGFGSFCSGLLAGVAATISVAPFERIKVVAQDKKISTLQALTQIYRHNGICSIYRGWSIMLLREVPGYGIYFKIYDYQKNKKRGAPLTPIESFLTGAACGIGAWTVIYPSDPIKSRMQRYNIPVKSAVNSILHESGIRGLYKGYHLGLLRGGLLHGFVLLGYETSKQWLSPPNY